MKNAISIICLVLLTSPGFAQNLCPNPSFEDVSNTFCGIMSLGDFASTIENWQSPTAASPQVFFSNIDEACYNFQPLSLYDGPIGIKGSQLPRTGNVMAGVWLYTIDGLNQRQYVQSWFDEPLVPGNHYAVEFYVSLADSMEYYIDSLGAYLSVNPPLSFDDSPLDVTPQVLSDGFMDNSSGWTLVRDTIFADGAYEFITIGNFKDDSSTNLESNPLHSGAVSTYGAYYFIDDVSVEEVVAVGITEVEDDVLFAFPTRVEDVLNIWVPIGFEQGWIEVYSAQGRLVMKACLSQIGTSIDFSSQADGAYVVTLQLNECMLTQRVFK